MKKVDEINKEFEELLRRFDEKYHIMEKYDISFEHLLLIARMPFFAIRHIYTNPGPYEINYPGFGSFYVPFRRLIAKIKSLETKWKEGKIEDESFYNIVLVYVSILRAKLPMMKNKKIIASAKEIINRYDYFQNG